MFGFRLLSCESVDETTPASPLISAKVADTEGGGAEMYRAIFTSSLIGAKVGEAGGEGGGRPELSVFSAKVSGEGSGTAG